MMEDKVESTKNRVCVCVYIYVYIYIYMVGFRGYYPYNGEWKRKCNMTWNLAFRASGFRP